MARRLRFAAGASAVVLGTILVEDLTLARMVVDDYGDRIVAGIDARGDRIATRGWQYESAIGRDELIRTVAHWGVQRIVYTEISRDGTGAGYDLEQLAHVAGLTDMRVTASGGAKTLDDLLALRERTPANVDAAIVGRALYEGTLDLRAALAALNVKDL